MTENEKKLVMTELELALIRIAEHRGVDGEIIVAWKDLALQMAEVAKEALEYLNAKRGSDL